MADTPFSELFATGTTNFPDALLPHGLGLNQHLGAFDGTLAVRICSFPDAFPTMLACVSADDGLICFAHSPTLFMGLTGLGHNNFDNTIVAFSGGDPDTLSPVIFEDAAFAAVDHRVIDDWADHSAAHTGHLAAHAGARVMNAPANQPDATQPNATTMVRVSPITAVPSAFARVIAALDRPAMPVEAFRRQVLDPIRAEPAFQEAEFTHLMNWWKAVSCSDNAGTCPLIAPTLAPGPLDVAFRAWCRRTCIGLLAPLPTLRAAGGLADVTTAVCEVSTHLEMTEAARQAEAVARANVSFEDCFGGATFAAVCRFVRQAAHAGLPEIHRVMASCDKRSRNQVTINLGLQNASSNAPAIDETNLPKCTHCLPEVFRNHSLIGNSIELGEGLSPFSIICHGHPDTKDILMLTDQQTMVEAGSSVGLSDTMQFKTKDGRFPRTCLQASDKLWAFALLVRVCFGDAHVLTTALAASLAVTAPMILQLESLFSTSTCQGMSVAIRAMAFCQRKVGLWLRRARDTATTDAVTPPDFDSCEDDLRMQSYDSLPRIPEFWMEIVKVQIPELHPAPERIRGGRGPSTEAGSGENWFVLVGADQTLIKRFKTSGIRSIANPKDTWDTTAHGPHVFPTFGGQEICLKCQCAGNCKTGCKNAASHVKHSPDVVKSIHAHLDKCGVPKLE